MIKKLSLLAASLVLAGTANAALTFTNNYLNPTSASTTLGGSLDKFDTSDVSQILLGATLTLSGTAAAKFDLVSDQTAAGTDSVDFTFNFGITGLNGQFASFALPLLAPYAFTADFDEQDEPILQKLKFNLSNANAVTPDVSSFLNFLCNTKMPSTVIIEKMERLIEMY